MRCDAVVNRIIVVKAATQWDIILEIRSPLVGLVASIGGEVHDGRRDQIAIDTDLVGVRHDGFCCSLNLCNCTSVLLAQVGAEPVEDGIRFGISHAGARLIGGIDLTDVLVPLQSMLRIEIDFRDSQ